VRDFENQKRHAEVQAVKAMQLALEHRHVMFLSADDRGGPGVRLAAERPNIIRRPAERHVQNDVISFQVEWANKDYLVFLPDHALDDADETNHRGAARYIASFDKHELAILDAVKVGIEAGRVKPDGRLYIEPTDFLRAVAAHRRKR
jgi:hypothetical protein